MASFKNPVISLGFLNSISSGLAIFSNFAWWLLAASGEHHHKTSFSERGNSVSKKLNQKNSKIKSLYPLWSWLGHRSNPEPITIASMIYAHWILLSHLQKEVHGWKWRRVIYLKTKSGVIATKRVVDRNTETKDNYPLQVNMISEVNKSQDMVDI